VIVHLLAQEPEELTTMVERLELVEGVTGIEVGLAPEAGLDLASALVSAAVGELPVIARLPLERCGELFPALEGTGVSAVSLGPSRGSLPDGSGDLVSGRLYGPSVFPLALRCVQDLAERGTPVIGAGGIYTAEDFEAMRSAGAVAVQLDAVLWRWDLEWVNQIV
jgi:dihydroorotate dehydrogenase (NAD+) catalytic subunit